TASSSFVKARSIDFGNAHWTKGFWAERFALCREVMVPTMGRLMTDGERFRYVGNFEVATGAVEGRHRGPKWNDGDFYKWLEAAAAINDPDIEKQLDSLIELIGKAQEADGYIHTDVQIAQREGKETPRFGNPLDFEMYNMGHLITAACVHHRATGKSNLLKLARKSADFLERTFANPTPEIARHGICPSHLMGLVELYRTTREKKYLDLAIKLLNMRDLVTNGDDDNQDRVPFRQQSVAHGHAVRATYLYAGAADIYLETGDRTLLEPLNLVWDDLVAKKLYITGGCGALYDGASPDGIEDQKQITRVHQAFGRDFQLPQSTAHNETCAAIGNLFWNWRMFQITGEARFADLIEHTLFNSVLVGISLDGTAFFYTNTLRQLNPMPVPLRWPRQRQKTMGCFCCPPNVVRTVAEASNYAYARNERGIYVLLYGGSQINTQLADKTPIKISQQTDYPWDGKITFTIESPSAEFSLVLRIPAWAKDVTIGINGKQGEQPRPGTFHEVRRHWNTGDRVELNLPMPARLIEANPYVEESRNQLAVARGPLVYCLESTDLPADVSLLDILLPQSAKFKTQRIDDLLPGMVALETAGFARANSDWSNDLYREAESENLREIDLRLIPYFAWGNRGESEMSVWLPIKR
ncbi:MAG TPA: glycoside hydrolase family 127 protein, partial [Tepidisphaeraceae bacterium]|nr:glycoside hydrolase family 127 protein [Tepidisphaeraceae bacterium]